MLEYIKNIRPVSPAPIYASTNCVAYRNKLIKKISTGDHKHKTAPYLFGRLVEANFTKCNIL